MITGNRKGRKNEEIRQKRQRERTFSRESLYFFLCFSVARSLSVLSIFFFFLQHLHISTFLSVLLPIHTAFIFIPLSPFNFCLFSSQSIVCLLPIPYVFLWRPPPPLLAHPRPLPTPHNSRAQLPCLFIFPFLAAILSLLFSIPNKRSLYIFFLSLHCYSGLDFFLPYPLTLSDTC